MKDKQAVIWTPLFRKIFLLVVSLFSLVFVLTLLSIYQAAYNQAEREFVARLNVGKNVFMNEIVIAKQHLDSSVETIAKDWALRSAIGQGEDTQSIKSVLSNHGKRINADIAIALDKKFLLIAQFGGEDMEIVRSLANVLDNKQQKRAWIAMVADEPYIVSAEPINAPATIGWLLMGKKLNKQFFQRIKLLISLDINLIITRQNSHNLVLSTINNPSALAQEIENLASTYLKNKESVDMYITQANDSVMMPFDLFTNNQQQFVILLQDSMSAWLKSRNLFMLELVPFFIVGILLALLGSFLIARSISRPVSRLLTAAKLVASGSYTEHIKVSERSELGELASEFNNMQLAVMEREQKIKAQAEEIRQINAIKYQVDIAQKEQQLAANATEAKSRFLANVSHEIRTPLNSIIGYSELLSDVTVSKDDKIKATAAIHNGGQYLLNLVNDVLDLSKIEAGKIQLNKTDVSIVALVDEVRSHMDGFALEKHLKFNLQLHYPLPYEFNTDATRLKQILLNLCNNAIKFTEQGQVDLQVHLDTFRKRFIFVVSDTGPGMTDEQQMRLFTAFSQGNQSSSRKYGGTGLGLYISKQLTEILGGHIKVTSQKGQGSQFAVYMPWVQANNQKMMTSEAEAQNLLKQNIPTKVEVPDLDAHILCVDDNEDNRQLVAYLVNKTGAKLSLAESGMQAIELVQNHQFDLVLMDMQMPEMDGIQTTKLLLEQGLSAPIVMLTANVDTKSKNAMLAAGVKQHFAKPIHTQSFYHLLDSYLGQVTELEELVDEYEVDIIDESNPNTIPNSASFDALIENYRNSFANKLALIQQAIQQEDWSEISRMMHNLKGSAGSYGFQVLSNLAKRVEDRIEQEKIAEAKKYLADLILCMQQLHQVDD